MDILTNIIFLSISIFVLVKASDWFIDAAEKIGLSFGISPFIIGVTIVAAGTSLPELATSIIAVLGDNSELVIGGVVGSNITNILLVLSLTAILGKEIILDFDVMDVDMPMLIGSAILLFFAIYDGNFSIFEAILFLMGMGIFLANSFKGKGRETNNNKKAGIRSYVKLLFGGALVWVGADFTITYIEKLALIAEINPEIIALTLLAFGTSLPEVVVSIMAAKRGKSAMAVGNVIGSNLFNTFAILGIPRLIGPLKIPAIYIEFSTPLMVGVTLLFALMCVSRKITKWEGYLLFALYVFFIGEVVRISGV